MVENGVKVVSRESRHYQVLDEVDFSSELDEKMGIYKTIQLVRTNTNDVEIRVCYYTLRKRSDGSEWWGLSPRPLSFPPEEAKAVAEGIMALADKFMVIKSIVEKSNSGK